MLPDLIIAAVTASHGLVLTAFLIKWLWDYDPFICLISLSFLSLAIAISSFIFNHETPKPS